MAPGTSDLAILLGAQIRSSAGALTTNARQCKQLQKQQYIQDSVHRARSRDIWADRRRSREGLLTMADDEGRHRRASQMALARMAMGFAMSTAGTRPPHRVAVA